VDQYSAPHCDSFSGNFTAIRILFRKVDLMRKYDEVQELLKRLRSGNPGGDSTYPEIMNEAADEIEAVTQLLEKQQAIIKRVYADEFPNTWFPTSGLGPKDSNGLPQYIEVCPAYGVGWTQLYEKTERTISTEGS
jgi:hypothetical protein